MHPSLRGILLMISAALCFASMGACLKYVLSAIPIFQAVFFRTIVSSLLLGLIILRKRLPYLGNNRRALLLRSLSGFLAMTCVFYALAHIPLADAAVLHQTAPLFVALFGFVLLKEQVRLALLGWVGLALLGVVLVLQPRGAMITIYGLVAVLGGAFAGLAYVFVRRLHQSESSWIIAFHFASVTSLLALPLMIWDFVLPTPLQWWALLGAGLFGTGGQILMTVSYRYDEAARLAPFSYAGAAFSFIYGMMFWGELPNIYKFIGMALIVLAGTAMAHANLKGRRVVALGDE